MKIEIREKQQSDQDWIEGILKARWGDVKIVSRERMHDASKLPAFIAIVNGIRMGLITYRFSPNGCEIKSVDSLRDGMGIGKKLIDKVKEITIGNGMRRLWLITTNDNCRAIGYFQIQGFHLTELYPGIVEKYRQMKPQIPEIGYNNIPIRDELVLEMKLR
ncbi:MAG: GNAT family N-acetyltransferase [Candidatus Zixiibacteriota bacterium]